MCFGEGHKLWFERLEGGKNRSLSTEFILPVGEDSTLYKALKAVFSLGAVKEGDGQGCTKLVSVVSRIPDKLLIVRQITLKITTKKVGPKSKLLT